ncbi:hypothetical protein BLOT_016860, partial [Blomia tropicalis]
MGKAGSGKKTNENSGNKKQTKVEEKGVGGIKHSKKSTANDGSQQKKSKPNGGAMSAKTKPNSKEPKCKEPKSKNEKGSKGKKSSKKTKGKSGKSKGHGGTPKSDGIASNNISSPIAASMGDICSLSLLAIVTQTLANVAIDSSILLISIIFVLLMFVPLLFYIARSNRFTKSSIVTGWVAILSAIVVEQPGGLVMASAFERYPTISTIQRIPAFEAIKL